MLRLQVWSPNELPPFEYQHRADVFSVCLSIVGVRVNGPLEVARLAVNKMTADRVEALHPENEKLRTELAAMKEDLREARNEWENAAERARASEHCREEIQKELAAATERLEEAGKILLLFDAWGKRPHGDSSESGALFASVRTFLNSPAKTWEHSQKREKNSAVQEQARLPAELKAANETIDVKVGFSTQYSPKTERKTV